MSLPEYKKGCAAWAGYARRMRRRPGHISCISISEGSSILYDVVWCGGSKGSHALNPDIKNRNSSLPHRSLQGSSETRGEALNICGAKEINISQRNDGYGWASMYYSLRDRQSNEARVNSLDRL